MKTGYSTDTCNYLVNIMRNHYVNVLIDHTTNDMNRRLNHLLTKFSMVIVEFYQLYLILIVWKYYGCQAWRNT